MHSTSAATSETAPFANELARWRAHRRLSKRTLAAKMGFDPSYVSHVESGRYAASEDFARRAENALSAGGALWHTWQSSARDGQAAAATSGPTAGAGLIVEDDDAELRFDGNWYHATMRRRIHNAGAEPVTRYLIRISVDRYPGEPERSNQLYRDHPLSWSELGLTATCDGEEMTRQVKHDRDSFKEVWLLFENARARFPLYPGEQVALEYAYTVSGDKWGPWFQRAVRLPTRHLSVRLIFPAELQPAVWGTETSTTAEALPLRTPIQRRRPGDEEVFAWATDQPPLNARYRLEWRFRADPGQDHAPGPVLRTASDRMAAAGIVQRDEPILSVVCEPFDLLAEASAAREVIDHLFAAMARVREHHAFGKGMGLAAPQIGIPRAAAVVQPPEEDIEPIVLLNPRVIAESPDTDEQYEGCLSFFDVRGMVRRPLRLEVERTTLDGERVIAAFDRALARLVTHEIDHLNGLLYTDRMRPGVTPIPVEECRGGGQPWSYQR